MCLKTYTFMQAGLKVTAGHIWPADQGLLMPNLNPANAPTGYTGQAKKI
jgi:hypothetical protein